LPNITLTEHDINSSKIFDAYKKHVEEKRDLPTTQIMKMRSSTDNAALVY
jgi:hypothetical protein